MLSAILSVKVNVRQLRRVSEAISDLPRWRRGCSLVHLGIAARPDYADPVIVHREHKPIGIHGSAKTGPPYPPLFLCYRIRAYGKWFRVCWIHH